MHGVIDPAAFATVFVALFVAHQVGDYWAQPSWVAMHKGCRKPCVSSETAAHGVGACIFHVIIYVNVQGMFVLGVAWVTGLQLDTISFLIGLLITAVTHYLVDRRWPLRWMALRLGKDPEWLDNGGGLLAMDQSWHYFWLLVTADVMVLGAAV